MRILKVTNKVKTYALGFQNVIETLLSLGHSIVWAADFSQFIGDRTIVPCTIEQIPINSNPLCIDNIKAYKRLLKIIDEYDIEGIVCSTPIGGALARLAAKEMDISPVLYEAHGFLFFKGAPVINQTIFRWEEQLLAHYTDTLVTITKEDYQEAQKFKLRNGSKPYLVHGAGVKIGIRVDAERSEKRKSIGVPENAFMIVSAGELNKNKNTEIVVKALYNLPEVHYVACGVGPEKKNLERLALELGVENRFHTLGYRIDMPEIMASADVFTMMSFREGLPRALLEAMDLGLPCVCSNTRGIRDLIDSKGGYICNPRDIDGYTSAIRELMREPTLRIKMGEYNKSKAKEYSSDLVRSELLNIYKDTFSCKK